MSAQISVALIKLLVCPVCQQTLKLNADELFCQNSNCRLSYPVRNGVPVMLVEEATRK